jgi:hypothetical protein
MLGLTRVVQWTRFWVTFSNFQLIFSSQAYTRWPEPLGQEDLPVGGDRKRAQCMGCATMIPGDRNRRPCIISDAWRLRMRPLADRLGTLMINVPRL